MEYGSIGVGSDEDAGEDGDSLTDNWLINPARRWRAHLSRILITFNNNVLLFGQSRLKDGHLGKAWSR